MARKKSRAEFKRRFGIEIDDIESFRKLPKAKKMEIVEFWGQDIAFYVTTAPAEPAKKLAKKKAAKDTSRKKSSKKAPESISENSRKEHIERLKGTIEEFVEA